MKLHEDEYARFAAECAVALGKSIEEIRELIRDNPDESVAYHQHEMTKAMFQAALSNGLDDVLQLATVAVSALFALAQKELDA